MYKHNILTSHDKRKFSYMRNACKGQLHMARSNLNNMYYSDLISSADKYEITRALRHIDEILHRWGKHYSKKVFEQLEKAKEENKENI